MTRRQVVRAGAMALYVMAVLAAVWVLPPMIHRARHLCPLRPDGVREAGAMPQWARRYGFECTVCHTTVPELTQVGYKFRAAGFRMPDEIGSEAKFNNIGDMYSVRVREDFSYQSEATNGKKGDGFVPAKHEFLFNELTFYPISGAIGKYWGAETELTFMPDELPEVENAYARFTYPVNQDLYIGARAGIMHPFEGYGGSDRPLSNFRPAFQNTSAKNGTFDARERIWGDDQQGAEFGITYKDTRLSLAIFNGFNSSINAADSAKRNTPGANITRDDDNNRDFLFFFNQMIGDKAAVSAEYLSGKSNWAYGGGATTETCDPAKGGPGCDSFPPPVRGLPGDPSWTNNYQKFAAYGNYDFLSDNKFRLMGGWALGHDHMPNTTNNALADKSNNSDSFNSTGWYVRAQSKLHEHLTAAACFDTYRPSLRTTGNRISAVTLTAAIPFQYVKFMIDYQIKRTQKVGALDVTNNTLQFEWMVHF